MYAKYKYLSAMTWKIAYNDFDFEVAASSKSLESARVRYNIIYSLYLYINTYICI